MDEDSRAGKYLTFEPGGDGFGIQVLQVLEIVGIHNVTNVPPTPPHVKGVIDLRGKVIPIVDLRLRVGLEAAFSEWQRTRAG